MRNYNQNLLYSGLPVGMNMNNLAMMGVNPQNLQNFQQNLYNQIRSICRVTWCISSFKNFIPVPFPEHGSQNRPQALPIEQQQSILRTFTPLVGPEHSPRSEYWV